MIIDEVLLLTESLYFQIIMEEPLIIVKEEDIEIRIPSLSDCNEEEQHTR